MKLALVLGLLAVGPAAEKLTPVQVGAVTLGVPGAWKRATEEGTVRYSAPSGEAYFLLDVAHVATRGMDGETCRKKILAQMGGTSDWTLLSVGGSPAARKLDVDPAAGGKAEVQTYTFVGCNGVTTWSLVFHLDARKKERFAPLAERVVRSLAYAQGGG